MWSVWDKKIGINGFSVDVIFERFNHLKDEETIFAKTVDGRVTNLEGKNILSKNYGIDPTLDNEAFIAEYERILAELIEETDGITDSEVYR